MRYIERIHGYHPGQYGLRIGRFAVQVTGNGSGAPLFDDAWLVTEDGRRFGGKCMSLVRRRNRHGERESGRALFVGWRQVFSPANAQAQAAMETRA